MTFFFLVIAWPFPLSLFYKTFFNEISTPGSQIFQIMLNWNKTTIYIRKPIAKNKFEVAIWRYFPVVTR